MTHEKVSYMMLFCALILVKKNNASLEESMVLLPLAGPAKGLAEHLMRSQAAE